MGRQKHKTPNIIQIPVQLFNILFYIFLLHLNIIDGKMYLQISAVGAKGGLSKWATRDPRQDSIPKSEELVVLLTVTNAYHTDGTSDLPQEYDTDWVKKR